MRVAFLALVLGIAGCAVPPGGPPVLVSGQSPPAADSSHSEPQPLGAFPVGAANYSPAPGATHPNFAALSFYPPVPFLGPPPRPLY